VAPLDSWPVRSDDSGKSYRRERHKAFGYVSFSYVVSFWTRRRATMSKPVYAPYVAIQERFGKGMTRHCDPF
jgi:hypothetical protein